ncbi:molybdate ABC transporter substrate-binding protein [Marinicella sp. S1101]|uniref:molybdate ABC transporter substrate-binding protein n=1 Tax=Marinicella marina TaxID=2996016 RepID=UPI0022608467|nr:molybdate ABC transporter substrate-binding protein [Marinicella marina]MCX7552437.1 molybdate ABC transporter substrate-binding protein [Marinicella marina]MDJ1139312.1 molybdate ABC transporter substrate-binding protein [Marinicella marina]
MIKVCLILILLLNQRLAAAEQLNIAVASNFHATLSHLAVLFEQQYGHEILISAGATGQLYAQIKQGAPFDVLMAADIKRPAMLVSQNLANELTVYATGQLVLVANGSDKQSCEAMLTDSSIKHIAIADPNLAPYGLAAKQFLQHKNLWQQLSKKSVIGNNVAQAMHMVASGNATVGLVARSQLADHALSADQCQWLVPTHLHAPIEQGMVFLKRSQKNHIYQQFKVFLQSHMALGVMQQYGYLKGPE